MEQQSFRKITKLADSQSLPYKDSQVDGQFFAENAVTRFSRLQLQKKTRGAKNFSNGQLEASTKRRVRVESCW